MKDQRRRYRLVASVGLVLLFAIVATTVIARARSTDDDLIGEIGRHAHPLESTQPGGSLTDLQPLGKMVGDAVVVGMGEATHSSREFFTLKHRVFRYLVEELGFTTFALETNWSTGLRLNRYVLHGQGDPAQIMQEEFSAFWVQPWNTQEYLDLIEWMRAYNEEHSHQVQFMAFDTYYPAGEVIDEVVRYVERHHPDLLASVSERYEALRPADLTTFMAENWNVPLPERQAQADNAGQVLELLEGQEPGTDPDALAWAVQHARVLHQTASLWAYDIADPQAMPAAMEDRDRFMADNTAWWQEHTDGRVLVSAHNGHIANQSLDPGARTATQGSFLRQRLGKDYVSIGFSFNHGSFNAQPDVETSEDSVSVSPQMFTLGPAKPGSHAYTLERVGYRNYMLDLRTAPERVRDWLDEPRSSRDIGSGWPVPEKRVSLTTSYDILFHLHEITAARLLT